MTKESGYGRGPRSRYYRLERLIGSFGGHKRRYSSANGSISTIPWPLPSPVSANRRMARDQGQVTAAVSACLANSSPIAGETGKSQFT
ncbi:hypothetical protein [Paenibacillus sp. N3.4]|uniref:hypothetical protein n=1 Tax=Paenibacillus sp. N3.4 TaxID=2603222 RepID=UPI0011CB3C26|nr:hypothetical protein [Paenibacillus sp. N3.4]TXK84661.1 hypothetical protein FU659_07470 [Paenibacillus sp. N3.4]